MLGEEKFGDEISSGTHYVFEKAKFLRRGAPLNKRLKFLCFSGSTSELTKNKDWSKKLVYLLQLRTHYGQVSLPNKNQ